MVILTTADVNVIVMDFPNKKGHEMVVPNEDGSYTIFINAGLNRESQLKAYEHAMKHIENDDFQKTDVQEIEYIAHKPLPEPEPAQTYLDRIKYHQRNRRKIKRQMKQDKTRVEFIMDNCDLFKLAEHHYLYGDDL